MMEKKLEKLRRLVQDLGSRYGNDDPDVLRLQTELSALEAIKPAPKEERRKANPGKRNFQSVSRQFFDATRPGDLH
jgi:hypothetical protein